MKIVVSFVFAVYIAHIAESRLSKSDLRKSLGASPVFSHRRDGIPEPQNVNLVDFVDGPITIQETAGTQMPPQTFPQNPPRNQAKVRPMQSGRTVNTQRSQPQNQRNGRTSRRQPSRQAASRGRQSPRPVPTPILNDRMADRRPSRRDQQRPPVQEPRTRKCPFVIPTFVIPDSSMTQTEFERRYLIPALRAHVQDERCNSPEMMIYLDLLLYMRERLFRI